MECTAFGGMPPDSAPKRRDHPLRIRTHLARATVAVALGATVLTGLPTLAVADTSEQLQAKLDEANAASSEAADKLSEAETRLSEAEKARETLEKTLESAQKENDTLSRRAQANELLVSAQAALEQGDYAALRSHLEALGAYADALKDDGAALYEILRSYID